MGDSARPNEKAMSSVQQLRYSDAETEILNWLDLKITTGLYSDVLLHQLIHVFTLRSENMFRIFDEIGALENAPFTRASCTKREAPFRSPRLRGLWHKHFQEKTVASLALNIANHWRQKKRFEELFWECFRAGDVMDAASLSKFCNLAVVGAYEDRSSARQITGEWIVFAPINGRNIYLSLGSHRDNNEAILDRVTTCFEQFPELKCHIGPKEDAVCRLP
jgi:hypothetical protein